MTNDIEDKIKELHGNVCRICKHFIRVNNESVRNVVNRQGFCVLGRLEGDYGLYVSCNCSRECMAFVYSNEVYEISKEEDALKDELKDLIYSLQDKRTTNYKLTKPMHEAHEEYLKTTQNKPNEITWFKADMELKQIISEQFIDINKDRYYKLYKMVTLFKSDYLKFLSQLSVKIHDEFCNCNTIQINEETHE